MKKILSIFLGLALCCMLAVLPACAEEAAAPEQTDTAVDPIGSAYVVIAGEEVRQATEPGDMVPGLVDEEAEAVAGTIEQAMAGFSMGGTVMGLVKDSGVYALFTGHWKNGVMILIAFFLLYLAIVKQFEPLLLMPIAFGMLLTNLLARDDDVRAADGIDRRVRLLRGGGFLGADGQRRKHAAQRQTEEYAQNLFHSALPL